MGIGKKVIVLPLSKAAFVIIRQILMPNWKFFRQTHLQI
jgi:hypothetical protein